MTATPTLNTDRLVLRAPDARDEPAMLRFLSSEFGRFYGAPYDPLTAWAKFASLVGQWTLRGYGMFAITRRDGGETVGMAGPYHPASFEEPEMAWLLTDPAHQGKGYAFEACRAVVQHLFETRTWQSLVSYIDTENTASLALAEKLGCVRDPATVSPFPGCDSYRHLRPVQDTL